eukprot:gnl/TRDRNA2_/TRDRNA2_188572_c0_seq1.p1 gnl/TRDRNA2_/TRDRNA2_188572_c0~~gnl/TRDRNA2_/TRDRNA2_188572_c0_seq1.p1  ORF type:complete len:261 (+),score=33.29 gnl/TRDRNA2_/TRDRNA2_188572_c0_seq1:79-861(+)
MAKPLIDADKVSLPPGSGILDIDAQPPGVEHLGIPRTSSFQASEAEGKPKDPSTRCERTSWTILSFVFLCAMIGGIVLVCWTASWYHGFVAAESVDTHLRQCLVLNKEVEEGKCTTRGKCCWAVVAVKLLEPPGVPAGGVDAVPEVDAMRFRTRNYAEYTDCAKAEVYLQSFAKGQKIDCYQFQDDPTKIKLEEAQPSFTVAYVVIALALGCFLPICACIACGCCFAFSSSLRAVCSAEEDSDRELGVYDDFEDEAGSEG